MYGLSCVGALGVCVGEDAPPRWWPRERERGREEKREWRTGKMEVVKPPERFRPAVGEGGGRR